MAAEQAEAGLVNWRKRRAKRKKLGSIAASSVRPNNSLRRGLRPAATGSNPHLRLRGGKAGSSQFDRHDFAKTDITGRFPQISSGCFATFQVKSKRQERNRGGSFRRAGGGFPRSSRCLRWITVATRLLASSRCGISFWWCSARLEHCVSRLSDSACFRLGNDPGTRRK